MFLNNIINIQDYIKHKEIIICEIELPAYCFYHYELFFPNSKY